MTAVEFLLEKWAIQGTLHSSDIEQAKEMEKQQIKTAFHKNSQKFFCEKEAEQYYNQTFKPE